MGFVVSDDARGGSLVFIKLALDSAVRKVAIPAFGQSGDVTVVNGSLCCHLFNDKKRHTDGPLNYASAFIVARIKFGSEVTIAGVKIDMPIGVCLVRVYCFN
ncbi:unnamed protein product [Dibothriocephalus latus]|uniref:Uncharacterized protein n=1 Tax=Dibothriocephalus latus TaxID=60516 RepID=A0A3P7MXV7_DIBLA|nr:unnamed protein product [Dibothriocephalus latus]